MNLSDQDRIRLALALLETVPPETELSDAEILQRDAELNEGRAEEISQEEFIGTIQPVPRS